MSINQDFDRMVATFNQLLQRCHDALAPETDQETRDGLRQALGEFLGAERKGDANAGARSGGSDE